MLCARAERLGLRTGNGAPSHPWMGVFFGRVGTQYAESHMRQKVNLDPGNWIGQFGPGTVLARYA